ncbi:Cytochrome P450 [Trinorchestia longiramus]|nr:Cytochrome P450 [Trinorchestia longiramus]
MALRLRHVRLLVPSKIGTISVRSLDFKTKLASDSYGLLKTKRDKCPQKFQKRLSCTENNFIDTKPMSSTAKSNDGKALPYEIIPGPPPLPVVGNMFIFSKFGEFPLQQFWDSMSRMRERYGAVVRVARVKPDLDMVWLFQPEDIRMLYKDEDTCPIRPPFDLLLTYRNTRPLLFTSPGLINGNGQEWKRLRLAIPSLLKLPSVAAYRERQASVSSALAETIKTYPALDTKSKFQSSQKNTVSLKSERPNLTSVETSSMFQKKQNVCGKSHDIPDVLQLLFRYTLEAVGVVALGRFQGCLSATNTNASKIIAANDDFLNSLGKSIFALPLYKVWPTHNYVKLRDAHDYISSVVEASFQDLESDFRDSPSKMKSEQPFVWALMTNESLSRQDRLLLLTEVFMGGIDATASTLAFCLYFLSRSPHWQEKLHREVRDIDGGTHNLQDLPVARGVLKESYRLRPSPSGVARVLQRDTVIGGYIVNKGVLVQGIPFLAARDPEQFANPDVFNPARWIRTDLPKKDGSYDPIPHPFQTPHPFAMLPFSHGVRMCPGRRLAEQELILALIQLSQSFVMEDLTQPTISGQHSTSSDPRAGSGKHHNFQETGIGQVLRLNMMPDSPIAIRFIERDD